MIHYKIFEKFDEKIFAELKLNNSEYTQNIFQLDDWLKVTAETANELLNLRIVIVYNYEKIICIVPLEIKTINGCRQLSWLSSQIIDYNNAIFLKDYSYKKNNFIETWNNIIKEISSECDLIYFNKVPEFIMGRQNPLIKEDYKFYQFSYQLNLTTLNFEKFYNYKNNNKTIQTDRRKKKKLNEGKNLVYVYKDCNKDSFLEVEELLLEKIRFYKDRKIKTFESEIINKYKKLISNNNEKYRFKICHCIKDKKKISSIFGVVHEDIFYYLIPLVYNHKLNKYSPGRFHIIDLINWSIVKKLKFIDFTAGDEFYKSTWSNQKFKMYYHLKLLNFKGLFRFIILNLYYFLRTNKFLKEILNLIRKRFN